MTIVDRSNWGRLRVTGGDRVRFLRGLTTVDVAKLADGAHGWGAILTPKGRVVSVVNVTAHADHVVVACEASIADKTRAVLERYAVMDDVAFDPITGAAHQDLGWRTPIVDGAHADALPDSDPTAERARIRAGFLKYGADVDEDCFPFETPLAAFLDYEKGCYVGQEPVFRVHAQGNTARMLRLLRIDGDAPIAPGATIAHPAKSNAGAITSSVVDDDGAHTLALGYIHRTCWDAQPVAIDGRTATVSELIP